MDYNELKMTTSVVLAWATRKKNANKNYGHNSTMKKE
jgi:hypothetical protein